MGEAWREAKVVWVVERRAVVELAAVRVAVRRAVRAKEAMIDRLRCRKTASSGRFSQSLVVEWWCICSRSQTLMIIISKLHVSICLWPMASLGPHPDVLRACN